MIQKIDSKSFNFEQIEEADAMDVGSIVPGA